MIQSTAGVPPCAKSLSRNRYTHQVIYSMDSPTILAEMVILYSYLKQLLYKLLVLLL
jgi:hypothetical protein